MQGASFQFAKNDQKLSICKKSSDCGVMQRFLCPMNSIPSKGRNLLFHSFVRRKVCAIQWQGASFRSGKNMNNVHLSSNLKTTNCKHETLGKSGSRKAIKKLVVVISCSPTEILLHYMKEKVDLFFLYVDPVLGSLFQRCF